MKEYCGFIEVWNDHPCAKTYQHSEPIRWEVLQPILDGTIRNGLYTVAIFKIKLK